MIVKIIGGLVGVAFLFGAHYYFYYHIKKIFKVSSASAIFVLSLLSGGFLIMEAVERFVRNYLAFVLYFFTSLWVGVFFFFISAFLLLDFLSLVFKLLKLKLNYQLAGKVLSLLVLIISVYSVFHARQIEIKTVSVPAFNLEKSIKIIQLSDMHLGAINSQAYLVKIVDMVNKLSPDFVLITGDLFDESDNIKSKDLAPLKNLHSTYGAYFVLGNHDRYFGEAHAIELVKEQNISVLRNEVKNIGGIQLIGIDYPQSEMNFHNEELKKIKIDQNLFSVLMYHSPSGLAESEDAGINLQISGHTHNGQIFPFSLIVKRFFPYIYGLYQISDNFSLYVSSGAGTWGPAMRFLTNSEIVEINLEKK